MNLIISGPQGSGKGTQAKLLVEKFNLFHLEMGKLLRTKASDGTELGNKIKEILATGVLLPDDTTHQLASEFITQENITQGILFDGFPRRMLQVEWLEKKLAELNSQIDKLIFVNISREETIKRLSSRRICPQCGRNFNLISVPPKNDNLCDDCNIPLTQRADETPEAIDKRLAAYAQETIPAIEYFRSQGKVIEINGEQPVEKVFQDILEALGSQGQALRS